MQNEQDPGTCCCLFFLVMVIATFIMALADYTSTEAFFGYLSIFGLFCILFVCSLKNKEKNFKIIFNNRGKIQNEHTLYVKKIKKKLNSKSDVVSSKNGTLNSLKEIDAFFESLKSRDDVIPVSDYKGTFLDDSNYPLFYNFINKTRESLLILTWRVDEKLLSELLWSIQDREIEVKIITKNRIEQGYINRLKHYRPNIHVTLMCNPKIHAKIMIRDGEEIIIGSSNITNSSVSKLGGFLDCNTLSRETDVVKEAITLFESMIENKDCMRQNHISDLMYSRNNRNCLPLSLEPYFKNESKEIILLFSCDMVDRRIVERILKWNSETRITLYISDTWSSSSLTKDNLDSMKWLYDYSVKPYKNLHIVPVTFCVHSKLYLFVEQKIIFVSSQNLTVSSWQSLLDAGLICKEEKDFKYVYDSISQLKKSVLNPIEDSNLESITKPENTFSGTIKEQSIGMPWDLLEVNVNWKIHLSRNQEYFKLIKHKPFTKSNLEHFLTPHKGITLEKDPTLEQMRKNFLRKESITGRYSNPSRHVVTGKPSKNRQKGELKREIERFQDRLKISSSEKEKKKLIDGIEYNKKKLEKLE